MYEIFQLISSFTITTISSLGYFGIFLFMLLESAAIPIPSEIIMPFSGFLVFEGRFEFFWVVFWGVLGNLVGSIILYGVGYWGGRKFLEKYGNWVLISHRDLELADKLFSKYGQAIVVLSRMLPAVRTFISFPAGVSRMDFKKFSFYTFVGSVPWIYVLTQAGIIMGENWRTLESYFRKFDFLIGLIAVLFLVWWVRRHLHIRNLGVNP